MVYSEDYRHCAVVVVEEGKKKLPVAKLFGIARTRLDRWINRLSLQPKPAGHKNHGN